MKTALQSLALVALTFAVVALWSFLAHIPARAAAPALACLAAAGAAVCLTMAVTVCSQSNQY